MTSVFVDTHVHIYRQFDLARVFEATEKRASEWGGPQCKRAVLFLVDRNKLEAYPNLLEAAEREAIFGAYRFQSPDNAGWVEVKNGEFSISILQGKQWVSSERIEVLGVGSGLELADGAPAETLVRRIIESGGLAILPWSFGKWTGSRRGVVVSMMNTFSPGELCFGDIFMRANGSPRSLLAEAAGKGYSVLPGTDPLPMVGEEKIVGKFGVMVNCNEVCDPRTIAELLKLPNQRWHNVGTRQRFAGALIRWVRLRFSK